MAEQLTSCKCGPMSNKKKKNVRLKSFHRRIIHFTGYMWLWYISAASNIFHYPFFVVDSSQLYQHLWFADDCVCSSCLFGVLFLFSIRHSLKKRKACVYFQHITPIKQIYVFSKLTVTKINCTSVAEVWTWLEFFLSTNLEWKSSEQLLQEHPFFIKWVHQLDSWA